MILVFYRTGVAHTKVKHVITCTSHAQRRTMRVNDAHTHTHNHTLTRAYAAPQKQKAKFSSRALARQASYLFPVGVSVHRNT